LIGKKRAPYSGGSKLMEKIMKLHKLLLKLKHNMSIHEDMYSFPLSHSYIPRNYKPNLDNAYSKAITKALKDNIDIVEYAYNKRCIVLKLTIDKELTSSRNLTTWWLIEPSSSVFGKSTYFKWLKIKDLNSLLSNNTWTRNTIVTKTQKYIPEVLFTGKILSLGYPIILYVSNTYGVSKLVATDNDKESRKYYRLNNNENGICEYRFSILRNKNGSLKIDIGQGCSNVNLDDFLAAIMYTKRDNPSPIDIRIYSNKTQYKYITAIYIDDIPADIESLLRVQYVENKLTTRRNNAPKYSKEHN